MGIHGGIRNAACEGMVSIDLAQNRSQMMGFCKHGDELLDFIKTGIFFTS
jgi:hypothetical protein